MEHLHFYPNHEKIVNFKPQVIFSGILNGGKGWVGGMHRHNFCEVLYIKEGRGIILLEGEEYSFGMGDVVVYNTGAFHEERSTGEKISTLFFAISNVRIPGMDIGSLVPPGASPVIKAGSYDEVLKTFLSVMIEELNEKKMHYKAISTNIAGLLCYYILRLYDINIENPAHPDICGRAKDYMDKNYGQEINLDELAASYHISKYYFVRLFKEFTGLAPMKYLLLVRISAAKELLVKTDMPIGQIAYEVGYQNAFNFSRAFKNSEYCSPKEYRANARGLLGR